MNWLNKFKEEALKDLKEHGKFFVLKESTDCDHCTATSCSDYTDWESCEKDMNESYEWAEGPINYWIISEQEAAEFEPSFRDRVMENFENGRGNSHILH